MNKRSAIVGLLLILLAGLVYSNSFHGAFHFDDKQHIVESTELRDWHGWKNMVKRHPSRELLWLTFLANYQLSELETFSWHVVNWLLHALNVLLLYAFLRRLIPDQNWQVAVAAAAFFAVHPLQTESVTYIISRSELLVANFFLIGLLAWLRFRRDYAATGRIFTPHYLLVFLAFAAGLSSKESMAVFPAMLLLIEWLIPDSHKMSFWRRTLPIGACFLLAAFWTTERFLSSGTVGVSDADPLIGTTPYLLTESRVLFHYLRLFLLPIGLNIDPDIAVSHSLGEIPVLLAFLGHGAILAGALWIRKKHPAKAFFIFWFYLLLLPSSSFVALRDVMAEHRIYLALAGPAVLLAGVLEPLAVWVFERQGQRGFQLTAAMLIVTFGILAWQRNRVYADGLYLWRDTVAKSPGKSRPHYNLGNAYYNHGQYEAAISHYTRSLEIRPNYHPAFFNRGNARNKLGQLQQALADYLQTVTIKPAFYQGWYNLGVVQMNLDELEAARSSFEKVIQMKPEFADAWNALGSLEFRNKRYAAAVPYFEKALAADKKHLDASLNLASSWYSLNEFGKALPYFRMVVDLDPKNAKGWFGYALCLEKLNASPAELAALLQRISEVQPALLRAPSFQDFIRRVQSRLTAKAP